ncbi:hypothetical protein ACFPM0_18595 [Pseudonocardia sulfidoxydans]|uniref:hypothetical protein n=1 Tax=Pseudonocardia sulfidoxydans TaxID=54011 RepID=UPI0036189B45
MPPDTPAAETYGVTATARPRVSRSGAYGDVSVAPRPGSGLPARVPCRDVRGQGAGAALP